MPRFFHLKFGAAAGGYPDALIKEAIICAVDGTDPWIRAVSGYKRKLRPAVERAIDHVVALVDALPPAIVLDTGNYDSDPRLRTFFISTADMRKILHDDPDLGHFRRGQDKALPGLNALLVMEKQEKTILGAELSGEILLRDVPQITVSFERHRLFALAGNEEETRHQIKRKAFNHLLSLALDRISSVKTERKNLERYRALFQSKLSLLRRVGWGFDERDAENGLALDDLEKRLDRIQTELLELGGEDRMLKLYLDIVIDVLGRPEAHIWATKETLIVDRMGIKRRVAAGDAPEVTLDIIRDAEGRNLVVSLVTLPGEGLQN